MTRHQLLPIGLFLKLRERSFRRVAIAAFLFALTNFAVHILTAASTETLTLKTVATASAFSLVAFSLTMCFLEVLLHEGQELGLVDPKAILAIATYYIWGLCAILLAAHFEVIYATGRGNVHFLYTVLSSFGLFFAVLFQSRIESEVHSVFRRARTRFRHIYEEKEKHSITLSALILFSLMICSLKLAAKIWDHYSEVALYLVALDALCVLYATGLPTFRKRTPDTEASFRSLLRKN